MSLVAAKTEIRSAEIALAEMKASKSFEEFDRHWRVFLGAIEKVWIRTERGCQAMVNKFQPWQGKSAALRKKDMLLRYIKQARDADNHGIEAVVELVPGSTGYRFPGGSGYVERLVIKNNRIVEYAGTPMVAEHRPATAKAIRVQNHGEWFNPPTTHLGQALHSPSPVEIAEHALAFYKKFVDEAEAKFFAK